MGALTRMPKYDKVWGWINSLNISQEDGGNGYEAGIHLLLRFMPDKELDMVIAEIESYCETCLVEHDQCSMTDDCPCCEDTKQQLFA